MPKLQIISAVCSC